MFSHLGYHLRKVPANLDVPKSPAIFSRIFAVCGKCSRSALVSVRSLLVGLLSEATHCEHAMIAAGSGFDVPVSCLRTHGLDSKDNDVFVPCRDLNALLQHLAILQLIADDVIGRKQP